MTGPDCVVVCILRSTHTHTHTHTQGVGLVAAGPDYLDNIKEAGGGAQGTQGLSKNCIASRESFENYI